MLQDEEIKSISEETGFSPAQIERLYSRFTALDKSGNGSLSRQDCLAIPELAINPLCDRIVQMFFVDCDDDHDRINFRQFMKVLATFGTSHNKKHSVTTMRSRTLSRQESLNMKRRQSLCQASLLFDSIDPSPFSSSVRRHSRHSSYHDCFHEPYQHYGHHTTNQHSVHYAASTNHLPTLSNGGLYHHNYNNNSQTSLYSGGSGIFKKPLQVPLIDPNEPLNSKKQKLYFMFKIYDVNNDNLIDLNDLIAIIKMMVGNYVDDSRVRKIAERNLKEADKDCDGYINFDEFCKSFTRRDIVESLKVKFPHS